MKLSIVLVLVLLFLTSDAHKKKKKKASKTSGLRRVKQLLMAFTVPTKSTVSKTLSTTKPKANQPDSPKNPFHILHQITTEEEFYEKFNYSRLPQHKKGRGQSSADAVGEVETSALCSLRDTVVPLPLPRYGEGIIFPACAVLPRCIGCCIDYDFLTCKPTLSRKKKVFYYHLKEDVLTNELVHKLKYVELEEHVSCGCQCKQTPHSCNPWTQNWVEAECGCRCKPDYQREDRHCQVGFKYDSSTCGCVCARPVRDCPNAYMAWNNTECDCVCRDKTCPPRTGSLNPKTCECVQLRG